MTRAGKMRAPFGRIPIRLAAAVLVGTGLGWAAPPAAAQDQKYSPWPAPADRGTADEKARDLVDDLRALIDEAERSRAADPRFLRDLRDLARRYDRPWRVELLVDDFADGDFTANPPWVVTAGRYWIERGYGLRSAITPSAEAASGGETADEDLASSIIGTLLKEALRRQGGKRDRRQPAADDRAAIHVARRITNAFAIRVELTSWQKEGMVDLGPYQGENRADGYRLAYRPAGWPALELLRVSLRGTSVIEAYASPLVLEDQRTHVIEWTRDSFGEMAVVVDGKELMRAVDRGYRDPFDGFSLVNRGGDYVIGRIAIHGTE